ncbi:MAG: radical SAM protein [Candidatus Odinarchaeota archaeon]|nr:radical SAM protein [Candidatus Odinarchaeota archaeon]
MSIFSLVDGNVNRIKKCKICGKESKYISSTLGVCKNCILNSSDSESFIKAAHQRSRSIFELPVFPPKTKKGIKCNICSNECIIGEGERGYCGLRENKENKLSSISSSNQAILYYYLDPIPTNCVAEWFCPASTGTGFPKYAYSPTRETGYYNLAVFFYGCNFDCLFCQNWEHKQLNRGRIVRVEEIIRVIKENKRISCICYFGGSPEPQFPFVINLSRRILKEFNDRIMRICFEWNGAGNKILALKAAELALKSGGIVKFDIKAFDEKIHYALTGSSNKRVLENFEEIYNRFYEKRPEVPVLTASTLLVPGYVDKEQVEKIAKFIAELNPDIPYSLLVFHPDFMMSDLPPTPLEHAAKAYLAAKKYLKRVHVGNIHLLGFYTYSDFERFTDKHSNEFA